MVHGFWHNRPCYFKCWSAKEQGALCWETVTLSGQWRLSTYLQHKSYLLPSKFFDKYLYLKHILCIPKITKNLLSISKLTNEKIWLGIKILEQSCFNEFWKIGCINLLVNLEILWHKSVDSRKQSIELRNPTGFQTTVTISS